MLELIFIGVVGMGIASILKGITGGDSTPRKDPNDRDIMKTNDPGRFIAQRQDYEASINRRKL